MKRQNRFFQCLFALALIGGLARTAFGGPIILGGDDLDYHGNYNNGAGPNQKGWLYIQKALANMYAGGCITRPNDGSIAVLGCPLSVDPNAVANSNGHAGAAIHFAANVALGKTVNYYDLASGINTFFADLNSGIAKPAIIYIPSESGDAVDGIDALEGPALTAHANDLKNFVNSGGGLMAHVSDAKTSGWVTAVTGVTVTLVGCYSVGATLTPTGTTAFPGLSNSDIDINAGPCHSTFSGSLGGLSVLAVDGNAKTLIIGGGCGTVIGTANGDATFNQGKSDCAKGSICFDYTVPNGPAGPGTVNLSLELYQNGAVVNTLTSGPLTTSGTYCFTNFLSGLNLSAGGFDWKMTANFTLTGTTIPPVVVGTTGEGFTPGKNNDCTFPPPPPGCAQVTGEARCLADGSYSYTFNVTNNSGNPASQFFLTPVNGSSFTLNPQLTNLASPLQNGQSTSVTTTIGNVKAGDKVCFFVSLMSEKDPCCIVQVCPTLPPCGGVVSPSAPPPALSQSREPGRRSPARGRRRP